MEEHVVLSAESPVQVQDEEDSGKNEEQVIAADNATSVEDAEAAVIQAADNVLEILEQSADANESKVENEDATTNELEEFSAVAAAAQDKNEDESNSADNDNKCAEEEKVNVANDTEMPPK